MCALSNSLSGIHFNAPNRIPSKIIIVIIAIICKIIGKYKELAYLISEGDPEDTNKLMQKVETILKNKSVEGTSNKFSPTKTPKAAALFGKVIRKQGLIVFIISFAIIADFE